MPRMPLLLAALRDVFERISHFAQWSPLVREDRDILKALPTGQSSPSRAQGVGRWAARPGRDHHIGLPRRC